MTQYDPLAPISERYLVLDSLSPLDQGNDVLSFVYTLVSGASTSKRAYKEI
jgi:hypothetical protein